MLWIIAVCILVNLSAIKAKARGCGSPEVHMVVAIDSTKMTTLNEFNEEKNIVKKVLQLAKIKYALVVYTGENASIYKNFGEDTSPNGISLDELNRIQSVSDGFDFKSLFALRYNHMPDCLWLLRNNKRYSYPKSNLPNNPMGYDQPIPKVALNFGYPNRDKQMRNLTSFKDIQYNGLNISHTSDTSKLEDMKISICDYCIKIITVKPSFTVEPSTTTNSMTETHDVTPTRPVATDSTATKTQTVSQTVNPSRSFTTSLLSSTKEPSNTMEEMIKEYNKFLAYNITQVTLTNEDEIRKYIDMSSRLLLKSQTLQENIKPQNESIGFQVLDKLEKFCVSVGNTMSTGGLTTIQVHTTNLVVGISVVNISSFKGFTFGDLYVNHGFISLPPVIFEGQQHQGTGVIVTMIVEPFQSFIDSNSDNNVTLAGKVVSVITQPHPTKTFYPPVTLGIKHKDIKVRDGAKPSCVFWDFKERSWSTAGCSVTHGNASVTECQCNHMTHYAVLLSLNDKVIEKHHHVAMTIITYIGCSLSIVGVFLTLITFLCLPVLKSERTRIHCNLCIAIGLSQILFLAAGSKDLVEEIIACKFYAALMFYWFMSVFTWMLIEGVHLYQMIIIAFVSRSMMKFYYAVGWGLPAVIVTIASSIAHKGYGTSDFCWISIQNETIWAFAAPAAIVILVNTAVLVCVLRLRVKLDGSSEVHKTVKTGARVSAVLLPLLGMTWVFGFFSVLPGAGLLFQYLFAITNSLQGFMIFLFHCVGNSEVRKEFHRKAEHWYFVRTLSSNSITMTTNKVTPISDNASVVATTSKLTQLSTEKGTPT